MGAVPNEGRRDVPSQGTCDFDFLFLDLVLMHFSFHFLSFDCGGRLG